MARIEAEIAAALPALTRAVFSQPTAEAAAQMAQTAADCAATLGDQAGAAGAIAAINGLNVVVAPLFVLLYERVGWGPFVLNAAILVGLLAYALRQAMLRAISQTGPETEATIAGLERADEGGV